MLQTKVSKSGHAMFAAEDGALKMKRSRLCGVDVDYYLTSQVRHSFAASVRFVHSPRFWGLFWGGKTEKAKKKTHTHTLTGEDELTIHTQI